MNERNCIYAVFQIDLDRSSLGKMPPAIVARPERNSDRLLLRNMRRTTSLGWGTPNSRRFGRAIVVRSFNGHRAASAYYGTV